MAYVILLENDLEYMAGCAAAHPSRVGGQHVAKPCTAVLVIHKPTGIAVRVENERSQRANKIAAIEFLGVLVSEHYGRVWREAVHDDTCRCESCKVHA